MDYIMTMNKPAAWWGNMYREGLPLGNGFTGALVYGGAMHERIMLTHTFCWREGGENEIPDVSDVLPQMRQMIEEGEMPEADNLLTKELLRRGYRPGMSTPFPIADILLTVPAIEGNIHYRRRLNFSKEEACVEYNDAGHHYERRSFVSRARDTFVMEISSDGNLSDVQIELVRHSSDSLTDGEDQHPQIKVQKSENDMYYLAVSVNEKPFGAVMRVVRMNNNIVLLAKVFDRGDPEERFNVLKNDLIALEPNYDLLMSEHEPLHREMFERCLVEIDDDKFERIELNSNLLEYAAEDGVCPNTLTERMWAYGRYLLICSTAPGGNPCPLMGLWNGGYREGWAFNMANVNIEMIYWLACESGLCELLTTVFDYYEKMLPGMRENAQKVYGCRGILLSAVSAPGSGRMTCIMPHIVNWTGGAAWIAQFYYDYWLYTNDVTFLRTRAFPFMVETALFYQDFLVWKGDMWHVIPSVSPENRTTSYKGTDKVEELTQSSIDATMDIALAKELFGNLLKVGPLCGASAEEMEEWKRFLEGAPAYTTDKTGAVHEWNHPDYPDNDQHRHQSHIYPMFPGFEHSRDDKREMFHKALIRRYENALSYHSSWGLMYMAAGMARAEDSIRAIHCFDLVSRYMLMNNLFPVHNDWRGSGVGLDMKWAPFQIDADMGWTHAVQEMLLYSDEQNVDLLPALPKRWAKGRAIGLQTRNGIAVELIWDNGKMNAKLTAKRNAACMVHLPDGTAKYINLKRGEDSLFSSHIDYRMHH